jgi:cobalt-zinc-cadmium efflux system membrane fusion protein
MKYTLIICVSLLFITGCDQNSDDKHDHADEDEHDHIHSEHEGGEVLHITSNQFNSLGLALGEMDSIYTGNFIKANGVLDVPPAEIAKVTSPIGAFVKSIVPEFLPGSQIRKGQKLATLSHPEEHLVLRSLL